MRGHRYLFSQLVRRELHDTHAEFVELMGDLGYRLINLEGTTPVREAGASAHALALPRLDLGD